MDPDWIIAMQLELNQFERNKVWELVPRPKNRGIIGTKWVFRNKKDQEGNVVRNKARLVVQGVRPFFARSAPPLASSDEMRKKDTEIPPKRASV
jgi:Reverse transcriptase (RNA-dependent DNA polymerase)